MNGIRPLLNISYFTDPLCCWSWGFQPHIEAVKEHYGDLVTIKYVMGGMLPSWDKFHDEVNAVTRPAQMGPVWMHAAQLVGRPINHLLWIKDPPQSSYPACIAVKSAALQSTELGIAYFKLAQKAAMTDAKNIASWPVLSDLAVGLANTDESFNEVEFALNYKNEEGMAAFREDLALVAKYRVTRFPTLVVEVEGQRSFVIAGYRSAESVIVNIEQALKKEGS